jgi:hypothetical protein
MRKEHLGGGGKPALIINTLAISMADTQHQMYANIFICGRYSFELGGLFCRRLMGAYFVSTPRRPSSHMLSAKTEHTYLVQLDLCDYF